MLGCCPQCVELYLADLWKSWELLSGETFANPSPRVGRHELEIEAPLAVSDAFIGASIAVNGVCLTVTEFDSTKFKADVAAETLARTNLGALRPKQHVHVERALQGRNGGHYVQGHVDSTGEVLETHGDESESVWLKIQVPTELTLTLVPKGFVAVDGASLTVVDVGNDFFTVMLVPHTQSMLLLDEKKPGDRVNVEVDVLAKYAQKAVLHEAPAAIHETSAAIYEAPPAVHEAAAAVVTKESSLSLRVRRVQAQVDAKSELL